MNFIATDLDRTLFPNGKQPYDKSMSDFSEIIEKNNMKLIYVTGRNLSQILEGIKEYNPPMPEYAIGEVGTKIYSCENDSFSEVSEYIKFIGNNTRNWDIKKFKENLKKYKEIRLQEEHNQNEFKLSYYVNKETEKEKLLIKIKKALTDICSDINIIYSFDETTGRGLLDVLPLRANKMEGLEFLRRKLNVGMDDIIYCGDSGNDLIPLTFGYKAILVKNAIVEVREEVEKITKEKGTRDRVYICRGNKRYNGYYVSGIIEGLNSFGIN